MSTARPFYVTTPIYYINDKPHVGTAYSTIAADVFTRYHRVRGHESRFLTGLDEHGLKIERRAKEEGLAPRDFADRMTPPFQTAWAKLLCEYDDFIRTTEPRHEERAQELWSRCEKAGDIYLGDYEDWYCVSCEQFYLEKDLAPQLSCPIHKRPVERLKEKTFFFKLSQYTEKLLAFYEANPKFVEPEGRFNEVKAFVREGLRDLSLSRTSFRWGVPVPGNTEHVMYVWFDALANYATALGAPRPSKLFDTFWPPHGDVVHIVGKDILRFHAVYWPAFLMSAGIAPPTKVFAHGWLTINGEKMGKSAGNFLDPNPLADALGPDVLRYYLMRDIAFGQDGDFNHQNWFARYNGELANGLGNLCNRVVAGIVPRDLGGVLPAVDPAAFDREAADRELIATARDASASARAHFDAFAPNRALDAIFTLVGAANRYVDQTAPWTLAKKGDHKRLGEVVHLVCESLRCCSLMLWPVMPSKCDGLRAQIGLRPVLPTVGVDLWPSTFGGQVPTGAKLVPSAALFPRIDAPQIDALLERLGVKQPVVTPPPKPKKGSTGMSIITDVIQVPSLKELLPEAPDPRAALTEPAPPPPVAPPPPRMPSDVPGVITIDDVSRVDLRVGSVVAAERVPKSDKLLKLMVDLAEEAPRQILAGIGKTYAPEALVGRKLVVVSNLAPRKMMGLESRGMVLAASDENALTVLFADGVAHGSRVK